MVKTHVYDVIIVGLGAMGSAAAYHLARRGKRVLGFDRFLPPHSFGSSHGQSRIIREAYFEDPCYVPLVQRAYSLWASLAQESGTELFLQTGGLMIGPPDGALVQGSRRSAEVHCLRHEILSANAIQQRFPALAPRQDMEGVWEARAGVLFPEKCVGAHLQLAQRHGADLRFDETIAHWAAANDQVTVETSSGMFSARQLVISAGSWVSSLLPDLKLPFAVERQPLFWFRPRNRDIFEPSRCPIYICQYESEKFFYGFPALGPGVKVAHHHRTEAATPETLRRTVSPAEVQEMFADVQPILPELSDHLVESAVCMYTNTPDGHFVIDRHPRWAQVLITSPCSGHGFKFAAAIGEVIADLVEHGKSRFDLSLFKLTRPRFDR